MRNPKLLAAGAVALLALTGCSTSMSSPVTPPSEPASESPTPSPTPTGTVTEVLPPIEIDGKDKQVDAAVGDTLDVITDGVTGVSTDNTEVLAVSQPRTDGSATFNAGAEVVGPGTAKLTVEGAGGDLYSVTVTATE